MEMSNIPVGIVGIGLYLPDKVMTAKEISEALQAQFGLNIAKSKIVQDEPIKSFGTYQLKCKLGYEITGTVNVVVTEEK